LLETDGGVHQVSPPAASAVHLMLARDFACGSPVAGGVFDGFGQEGLIQSLFI
jgi:hypothetical protein